MSRYEGRRYLNQEPKRRRKLLLHRKEINRLASKGSEKGLTLVPIRLYLKGSLAKVEVALAKGKKLYDKREAISRRDVARELARAIKSH